VDKSRVIFVHLRTKIKIFIFQPLEKTTPESVFSHFDRVFVSRAAEAEFYGGVRGDSASSLSSRSLAKIYHAAAAQSQGRHPALRQGRNL
jgi:hypothetical protein